MENEGTIYQRGEKTIPPMIGWKEQGEIQPNRENTGPTIGMREERKKDVTEEEEDLNSYPNGRGIDQR